MGSQRDRAFLRWRVILPIFVVSSAIYASFSMLRGESSSKAVVCALICAVLFVPAFLWLLNKFDTKAREKYGHTDGEGPVSRQSIRVRALSNEVLDVVIQEAGQIPRAKVVHSDQRRVDIRMGMSWRSWGERVQVEAIPEGEGTHVTVASRPVLRTTLFDYGKGQENVRGLLDALQKHGLDD